MSPVSRGRKPKNPRSRTRRGGSEMDLLLARLLRDVGRELAEVTDPLDAELCVSELLGSWWREILPDGADPEVVLGEGLIAHAARRPTTGALGLLRCLAVLGTPRQRELAEAAAEALAGKGVAAPGWAGRLGGATVTGCWAHGDVYGDQTTVLLAFERAGQTHGTTALVDQMLGGAVLDTFVVSEPAEALADLEDSAPLSWLRPVDPAEARALLEPAFAATDTAVDPPVLDGFAEARAVALARLRSLPAPARPPAPVPSLDSAERAAIVAEFLASPEAAELPEGAARCARLIVDDGCDHDAGRPLRISPIKSEMFLDDRLLDEIEPDDPCWDDMTVVFPAWVRWAGARSELPPEALAAVQEAADELVEELSGDGLDDELLDADGPPRVLFDAMLDGLDDIDPAELPDVLMRRMFAMPLSSARISGVDYPELSPADPDERRLLIIGEHPEYHAALDDPSFDATVEGVSPGTHIATHEMIAEQLWNGEPAQLWPAALRLLESGADRHEVLHALGHVALGRLYTALTEHRPFDAEGYAADLDALGAPAGRRRRRR